MTTGLPPPTPSTTPPPRVQLPVHELPADSYAIQEMTRETDAAGADYDPEAAFRGNLAAGLFPAALIVFLILAFVAIAWTVVAAAA